MTAIQLPSWEELKWPVAASILYVSLYYVYMCLQVVGKYRARASIKARLKKEGAPKLPKGKLSVLVKEDPEYMRGERTFLNMLEQMPVFLLSFWMYTLLVDPVAGGQGAMIYVVCRALYYPFYHNGLLKVGLSTGPNYAVIWYFVLALGAKWWASFGDNLLA